MQTLSRTLTVDPRVTLELIGEQHVAAGAAMVERSRPALLPWMPWAHEADEASFAAFVAQKVAARASGPAANGAAYAILVDGAFAGCIDFHDEDAPARSAQIGYWLGTPYTGRGIMTACVKTLVDSGFARLGLGRIEIHANVQNARSRTVAERAGFELETIRPRALTGREWDEAVYVRLAPGKT